MANQFDQLKTLTNLPNFSGSCEPPTSKEEVDFWMQIFVTIKPIPKTTNVN